MNNTNLNSLIDNANKGEINACYELGYYLLDSSGSNNVDRAIEFLNKAILGDHTGAMLLLGKLYFNGKIVPKEKMRGGKLIEKAGKAGNVPAQRVLGNLLFKDGRNKQGLALLGYAAENGDIKAHHILGSIYLHGINVEKDQRKVFEHLIPAAEAGYFPALELLTKHFNYEKHKGETYNKFIATLNKIPKHFPEPCHIVFLNNDHVESVIENKLDNDFYVFGMIIENTAILNNCSKSLTTQGT